MKHFIHSNVCMYCGKEIFEVDGTISECTAVEEYLNRLEFQANGFSTTEVTDNGLHRHEISESDLE